MHIHGEAVMYVYRGYDQPDGYEQRMPYRFVASIFAIGNGRARAFATHGDIDRATIQAMAADLLDKGIHTLLVERHGVEQEWSLGRATAHPTRRAA